MLPVHFFILHFFVFHLLHHCGGLTPSRTRSPDRGQRVCKHVVVGQHACACPLALFESLSSLPLGPSWNLRIWGFFFGVVIDSQSLFRAPLKCHQFLHVITDLICSSCLPSLDSCRGGGTILPISCTAATSPCPA